MWFGHGAAGLAIVALAVAGPSAADPGATQTCSSVDASAAADGVRTAFHGDNVLPLVNGTDAEGPSASALLSSGVSSAAAGAPNPGDAALSALALAGVPGVDSRTYPLLAQSQFPSHTHAQVDQPGISLTASSSDSSSSASAKGGGATTQGPSSSQGATTSTASVGCSGVAGAVASSDTDSEAFSAAGGVLRIGRIHSEARAVLGPDGVPHVNSHLDVGQFVVAGQTVAFTERGLGAGGQTVPLPNPLGDVLRGAGVGLRYISGSTDSDGKGVNAPGLEVSVRADLNTARVGTSPSTVTYTFGRAQARADATFSAADQSAVGFTPPPLARSPDGTPGSSGSTEAIAPSVPSAAAPGDAAVGTGLRAAPSRNAPISGVARARVRTIDVLVGLDWTPLYLALVLGGLALGGAWALFRLIGERLRWM